MCRQNTGLTSQALWKRRPFGQQFVPQLLSALSTSVSLAPWLRLLKSRWISATLFFLSLFSKKQNKKNCSAAKQSFSCWPYFEIPGIKRSVSSAFVLLRTQKWVGHTKRVMSWEPKISMNYSNQEEMEAVATVVCLNLWWGHAQLFCWLDCFGVATRCFKLQAKSFAKD